jgi:large subunit ribosomal protein L9
MKVILQQDVKGQGKKGQMIEVSDGYGRNFLLPRKLAVEATADNLNTMKMQEKAKRAEEARQKELAEETAEKLKGLTVKIYARSGKDGRLFGAVTGKEISDALLEQHGIEIAKQKLVIEDQIKSCGGYQIRCKLGYEVSGVINLIVAEKD